MELFPSPGMWAFLFFSVVCARDVGCWCLFVWCFPAVALSPWCCAVGKVASLVLLGLCTGCGLLFLVCDVVYQVVLVPG